MEYIDNILFTIILASGIFLFAKNIKKVIRNINVGRNIKVTDNIGERWKTMTMVALGQSKMMVRPVAGIMHIFIYVGFVIINIEVVEILIDGIFGTHRILSFMGGFYYFLISAFEVLAVLVLLACVVFLARRNIIKLKRFVNKDLEGWPKSDANYILFIEILLMSAFLFMNAADGVLMSFSFNDAMNVSKEFSIAATKIFGDNHVGAAYYFPVSAWLTGFLPNSPEALHLIERFCWWFHIVGILAFMNYLPYSNHFHILLAFPNVFYSNLKQKGQFSNLESVTNEVNLMMDPSLPPPPADAAPPRFGAKDVNDLSWVQLMNAYSCTECGRCSSVCPANQTGKLLSPRKIMMSTRDRLEEVGKELDLGKNPFEGEKNLLQDYITPEELWACTTCNACTEACPINIDPLSIIIDLRRYLVMEQSAAPASLNGMFTNIENNQAPWQFSPADRLNWAKEND
ncbi:MAG: 4Fe-4S dicluster domain-containing protein [Bacteroidota bacterium]